MPINHIFHFIHFGNSDITTIQKSRIESFLRLNPGYQIKIWRDSDFNFNNGPKFVQQCLEAKNYAYLSDYYRLIVLYENGGIYCDTDMECLKPLDVIISDEPLLEYEFINNDKPYIGTAIMGFPKGHDFLRDAIRHYEQMDLFDGSQHINQFVITDLYNSGKYDFSIIPHDLHMLYSMQEPGYHFTHHHADRTWQYQNEFIVYYDQQSDIDKTINSLIGKHIIICDNGHNEDLEKYGCIVIHDVQNINDAIDKAIRMSSAQTGYFVLTSGMQYRKDIETVVPTLTKYGQTIFDDSKDSYITRYSNRQNIHSFDKNFLVMNFEKAEQ